MMTLMTKDHPPFLTQSDALWHRFNTSANTANCFTEILTAVLIAIVKKEFSLVGFFFFKLRYTLKQHKIYLIYIMNQLLTTCTNSNVSYKLVDLQKKSCCYAPSLFQILLIIFTVLYCL